MQNSVPYPFGGSSRAIPRKLEDGRTATLQQLLVTHLVDLSALCIVPGQHVWRLHIDLYLLQCDAGNLLDATSHVMRASLANTLLPSLMTTSTLSTNKTTTVETDQKTSSKAAIPIWWWTVTWHGYYCRVEMQICNNYCNNGTQFTGARLDCQRHAGSESVEASQTLSSRTRYLANERFLTLLFHHCGGGSY
jgi:hypothetical protein